MLSCTIGNLLVHTRIWFSTRYLDFGNIYLDNMILRRRQFQDPIQYVFPLCSRSTDLNLENFIRRQPARPNLRKQLQLFIICRNKDHQIQNKEIIKLQRQARRIHPPKTLLTKLIRSNLFMQYDNSSQQTPFHNRYNYRTTHNRHPQYVFSFPAVELPYASSYSHLDIWATLLTEETTPPDRRQ